MSDQLDIDFSDSFSFETHLAYHYGNINDMRKSFSHELIRYKAINNPSSKVLRRIAEYERIIRMCDNSTKTV